MSTVHPQRSHPALAHLLERALWVFDMDGTLTVPKHDFAAFRQEHDVPEGVDLLTGLETLGPERAERVRRAITEWEWEVAAQSRAQPDALCLVRTLAERGAVLAVLTRNRRDVALETLRVAGFLDYFPVRELILGRDDAPPKPNPAGLELLARKAGVVADDAVMVGDWIHDVEAGARAGFATVLVERHGPPPASWSRWIAVSVPSLSEPPRISA